MIHVGLNLIFLVPGQTGGMEVAARSIIPHLLEIDDLRVTAFVNREAAATIDDVEEVVVPVNATNRLQWVRGEQMLLPRHAEKAGCDVVHSLGSTAPLHGSFRRVTTIHDLHYKLVPDAHFGMLGLGMRVLVPSAARCSHRLIAVSQATSDDLQRHLGVAAEKIDVVPQGVTPRRSCEVTGETDLRGRLGFGERRLILSAAAKRPHKNLLRLIEAHALLDPPRPLLIIPGYPTPHELELRDRAADLGTGEDVRLLPWVSDSDLEGLYAASDLFVFPSLYEGFGLPPLEAMARGLPVVTSSRGALAEVVGDAAVRCDPESVEEISLAIRRLLGDPAERERLRIAGLARSRQFSWKRTAELTAASYRRAVAV